MDGLARGVGRFVESDFGAQERAVLSHRKIAFGTVLRGEVHVENEVIVISAFGDVAHFAIANLRLDGFLDGGGRVGKLDRDFVSKHRSCKPAKKWKDDDLFQLHHANVLHVDIVNRNNRAVVMMVNVTTMVPAVFVVFVFGDHGRTGIYCGSEIDESRSKQGDGQKFFHKGVVQSCGDFYRMPRRV